MTIVSITYYLFLLAVLLIYYTVPKQIQWRVLLAASIAFFMLVGTPWTIVYLVAGICVTWLAGRKIAAERDKDEPTNTAKLWLVIALAADLGMLCALKYTNFFLYNAGKIYGTITHSYYGWAVNWPAALGISFYTLQIVGYILDCYWGISETQMNIGKFALFACFFPQMVSGPIGRYRDYKDQLYSPHEFNWSNIRSGTIRIIAGIFKKIAVSGNFGILASIFLNTESEYVGPMAFVGMIAYIIQIYADFAGCMDIVLGSAELFGIAMPENFNAPFTSKTIQEFWQRWHITLGLWLKDYVMYPILRTKLWSRMTKAIKNKWGKTLSRKLPTHLAMLVLWFCMGLWHGGGWNYIIEGVWFWGVIVLGDWLEPLWEKIRPIFSTSKHFWPLFREFRTIVVYGIGAIFFRHPSVREGCLVLKRIFLPNNIFQGFCNIWETVGKWAYFWTCNDTLLTDIICSLITFVIFAILCRVEHKRGSLSNSLEKQPVMFQIMILLALLYVTLLFGVYGAGYNASMFIYGGF